MSYKVSRQNDDVILTDCHRVSQQASYELCYSTQIYVKPVQNEIYFCVVVADFHKRSNFEKFY